MTSGLRLDIEFADGRIAATVVEVCASRVVIGYAVVEGLLFGAFLGYLSSAQQIFQDVYGLGTRFVLYFSCLSLAVGAALFVNGTLVELERDIIMRVLEEEGNNKENAAKRLGIPRSTFYQKLAAMGIAARR